MSQTGEPRENAEHVSDLPPALESPVGQLSNFCGKPKAEEIEKIYFSLRVSEAYQIASNMVVVGQRLNGVFHASGCKILEERISGSQRQQTERRAFAFFRLRKKPVYNFVGCPVATNREKIPEASSVSVSSKLDSFSGASCRCNFEIDTRSAHALESGAGESP